METNKFNARELRIGNRVNIVSHADDVGISAYGIDNFHKGKTEVLPIKLNEEQLLRFGFKKIGSNYEFHWLLLHGNIKTGTVDFLLNEPNTGKMKVTVLNYVHQLQNLYFALTGVELQLSSK